jgi:hypothetical protein
MPPLSAVGLCGVDQTVNAEELLVNTFWPTWIEFGILVHGEHIAGTKPRCPSLPVVRDILTVNNNRHQFAVHMCSTQCQRLLDGDASLLLDLHRTFHVARFQINATMANQVNSSLLSRTHVANLEAIAKQVPTAEFILQRNEETKPLWQPFDDDITGLPNNISMLFDSSVGRGVTISSFPRPSSPSIKFGYAGGLNPSNVFQVVSSLLSTSPPRTTWIDMESGIRANDSFSIPKAQQVCVALAPFF